MLNSITQHWILNRIYDEANWAITKFHATKDNIDSFIMVSEDIFNLLQKEEIRYSHLSIQGLNAHHTVNVAILNAKIGQLIGVDNIKDLIIGGMLHDIGKLFIPRNILTKPTALTLRERAHIDQHPDIGFNIISKMIDNKTILDIIKNHHLYIKTLNNPINLLDMKDTDAIYPLICGISDITDAMFSYRSYKKPLSLAEVKSELINKGIKNIDEIFEEIL